MKPRVFLKNLMRPAGLRLRHTTQLGVDHRADIARLNIDGDRLVVFDVGANKGQFLRKFFRVFPHATVHAFEPGPGFEKLKKRVGPRRDVTFINQALGSASGTRTFSINSLWGMSSFLKQGKEYWGEIREEVELEVDTIDAYCAANHVGRISLLKIDTQGYELEILKGAGECIRESRIHMVYLELIFSDMYENLPRFDTILTHLLDNGFRLVAFYEMLGDAGGTAGWTEALFVNPAYGESGGT